MKLVQATILAGALLSVAPAFAAPNVTLSGPASATPGSTIQLTVAASDFSDLYAYQFDVSFNAAAFNVASVTEGNLLATQGTTFFDGGTVDNSNGTVSFILNTLIGPGSGATGSGSLATLTFNVGSSFTGSSSIGITNFVALDSALNPIDVSVQGLTVSAVPEPSALALTLAGLGFLGGLKLKRKVKQDAVAA